jgi:hypothetical protein
MCARRRRWESRADAPVALPNRRIVMRSRNHSFKGMLLVVVIACATYGCGGSSTGNQQLAITTASLPNGTVGTPYVQTIEATGGAGPFTWVVSTGALPHNLTLSISTTSVASISGTPDMQQTAVAFSIKVTDSGNHTASQSYSVTIGPAPISVSVSPPSASMVVNNSQPFTATVQNDSANNGVTWALTQNGTSCSPGCGALSATSSASGAPITYTTPATVPANATVTLTATSVTDNTKSVSATITITGVPSISVNIGPTSALIQVTGTVHFQAGVAYDPNNAGVSWTMQDCTGGVTVCGSITNVNNSGPFTADYMAPATVPPGGPLSVVATSVTDPTRSASATVTISPIDFTTHNYPAGNTPNGVAVGDFNGDGKLDIAVADYGNPATGDNGGVSILLGNGDGTFQPAISVNAGKNPISIAVGDFNNDGKKDLVLADYGDRQTGGNGAVEILLGNGDGTFQSPITLSAGNEPFPLAVGDFNGDGKLDFAVTDFNSGVYLFLGNGDGSFQAPALISAGTNPVAICAADLNGDGKLDLAVADMHDPSSIDNGGVSILLGNGDGTFRAPVFHAVDIFPTSLAIGDLNGDGKPDLAISSFVSSFGLEGSVLNVFLGNGDGTFAGNIATGTGRSLSGDDFPLSVVIADFIPNGKPAVAEVKGPYVIVLPGNGDGTFQGQLHFNADQLPYQLAVGDFNGDGKPDIVVANQGSNDITILLNVTGP